MIAKTRTQLSVAAMLICVSAVTSFAGENPETFIDALKGGQVSLNMRVRGEYGEMEGLESSSALTVRTRLGYGTVPCHGLSAFIEMEDVAAVTDPDDYNQAGTNPDGAGKTVIADVEGTEVNQVFLKYSAHAAEVKAGRQRIILNDARIVGNVGWRQNEQTYDAVSLKHECLDNLSVQYAYIGTVNRIFGDMQGTSPAGSAGNAAEFNSDSHIVNVAFKPSENCSVAGYAALLNLGGGAVGRANSGDTYGVLAKGSIPVGAKAIIKAALSYANQSDNSDTTDGVDYSADYIMADLSAGCKTHRLGAGYEALGSDNGASFRTPLATGHKFNGWADMFLVTPAGGLIDTYAYIGSTIPVINVKVKAVYHMFEADTGSMDYGTELDIVASKAVSDKIKLIAKYASFEADSDAAGTYSDIERLSVELNLAF